jgi:hypothetical protein
MAFFAQTTASFCKKIVIIALVFEKNANFFVENCRKSQKIVIITSTPANCAVQKSIAVKTWDRGYDFKNIFAKKMAQILAFLRQTNVSFLQKKHWLFALFSPKMVENRRKNFNQNIDPRWKQY